MSHGTSLSARWFKTYHGMPGVLHVRVPHEMNETSYIKPDLYIKFMLLRPGRRQACHQ